MMNNITEIINEWDPIGFFPMAPKDEYINEINKIYRYIISNQVTEVHSLAMAINDIFLETFGRSVYEQDIEQCISVASKILNEIDISKK